MATVTLSYSDPAASAAYIDPAGGSWLEIVGAGGCGGWVGVIDQPQFDVDRLVITARQPWVLLSGRVMRWETIFRHPTSPGYIAGRVLREALSGIGWFNTRYLPADGSDAPLRNYQFTGQDAWSILVELMEQSTSELWIDAENGDVRWMGALAGPGQLAIPLVADGNLLQWVYQSSGDDWAAEVVVKRGTERYSLSDGGATLSRPAQVTITTEAGASLYLAARDELLRRTNPRVTVRGGVGPELWNIREGMFAQVYLPGVGFGGRRHTCRVLRRQLSDDNELMQVEMQAIEPAVGVRVAPPERATSGGNAGARPRGSFRQRLRANERRAHNTWLREH
jgi:hypothetical protein